MGAPAVDYVGRDVLLERLHALPGGVVTFLFTDLEGSTAAWERDAPAMDAALRTP